MPLVTQEWTFVDKLDWGAGPWVTEPDKVLWQDEATGYWCLANRNWRVSGSWCGYVAVPPSHPYFNKTDRRHTESSSRIFMRESHKQLMENGGSYEGLPDDDLADILEQHPDYEEKLYELECHGGVTWARPNDPPTKADFERWQKYMLCPETQQQRENFPHGDAAQEWADKGHLVNDYEAWYRWECDHSNYIETTDPLSLIGFDCSHCQDIMPKMDTWFREAVGREMSRFPGSEYRTLVYVQAECRSLARQLKELVDGNQDQAGLREGE
jgi:hypothetical protein